MAHSLLTSSREWSSLHAWVLQIAKHRGMTLTRVAVACKPAVVPHRMSSDKTELGFGKEAVAAIAPDLSSYACPIELDDA